jgi:hypothetical protein
VPDALLARFAGKVTDHWSQEQYPLLWRRFAPRILRLVAAEDSEPDRLLRGLYDYVGRFGEWPAAERTAVFAARARGSTPPCS